jgi:hypothetical protein
MGLPALSGLDRVENVAVVVEGRGGPSISRQKLPGLQRYNYNLT